MWGCRSPTLAPDERAAAPGATQRLRLAALRSVADTAAAPAAADVLQVVAFEVAETAAACLADSHPPAVRGAASEVCGSLTMHEGVYCATTQRLWHAAIISQQPGLLSHFSRTRSTAVGDLATHVHTAVVGPAGAGTGGLGCCVAGADGRCRRR